MKPVSFISYNRRDELQVKRIVRSLAVRGIPYWLDANELRGGDKWKEILFEQIASSPIAIIFFGPNGVGNFQEIEIHEIWTNHERGHCLVIPVLLKGGSIPERISFLAENQCIEFKGSGTRAFYDLVQAVLLASSCSPVPTATKHVRAPHATLKYAKPLVALAATLAIVGLFGTLDEEANVGARHFDQNENVTTPQPEPGEVDDDYSSQNNRVSFNPVLMPHSPHTYSALHKVAVPERQRANPQLDPMARPSTEIVHVGHTASEKSLLWPRHIPRGIVW